MTHYFNIFRNSVKTLILVASIISVANEARKQPNEKQHYEKKVTRLNNRQKQEENKSSEKSNEKNGSNKEKSRSSEKEQTKVTKVFPS